DGPKAIPRAGPCGMSRPFPRVTHVVPTLERPRSTMTRVTESSAFPVPPASPAPVRQLQRTLSHRHIHFIALGSAIGTGLFYGSSGAISAAGPGVVFVYLLGGAVVYFMLRALGEMAVADPAPGSFAE